MPRLSVLHRVPASVWPLLILAVLCVPCLSAEAETIGKATVTVDNAPIKDRDRVLATAKKGEMLDVIQVSGEWYQVNPTTGWVHRSQVRFEPVSRPGGGQAKVPPARSPEVPKPLPQVPAAPLGPREIAKRVLPSVVLLVMEDSNGQPLAMGSGFVIKDGIVATNLHVVKGASRGYAKFADLEHKFNITGTFATDAAHDIVLLAVEGFKAPGGDGFLSDADFLLGGEGLKARALTLGDSKQVAVGDAVYAVGNPRGLEGTFSAGIVSSIRKIGDDTLLQITAPISPGSSGGPVLNSKGEVVGVSVATFKGGQNLNFAIPSSYLTTLMAAPTKLVKFAGGAKEASPKVGSILDGLGGNSTEGVEGSDFLWNQPILQNGSFSITLRNKLREPVKNATCAVLFHNDNGEVLDFDLVTYSGIIPPGLGKRANSFIAESVQKLTTEWNGKMPRTKLVFRVLYFELVDSDKADDVSIRSPR